MSLTATIRAGVETAFSAAKELVRHGTYHAKGGDPVYDPGSDSMTGGDVQVPNVRMLRTSSLAEEREASPVAITDEKYLIPAVDLPGITPSDQDKIELDGVFSNVVSWKPVPGDSLYIVFARRR